MTKEIMMWEDLGPQTQESLLAYSRQRDVNPTEESIISQYFHVILQEKKVFDDNCRLHLGSL